MGTVAYISPEQARGAAVDSRSEQFSLGLILREVAMGKQTFRRESLPETMTAIIRDDAPALDASVPAPLRWVIEGLLEKDPEERYVSTKDLARDLRGMRERGSEASGVAAVVLLGKRRSWWPFVLAAGCLVAGAVLVLIMIPPAEIDVAQYRFTPLARDEVTETDPQCALVHPTRETYANTAAAVSFAGQF